MASCGFAPLLGDRVDQVQTIREMSSVWLWEAVQSTQRHLRNFLYFLVRFSAPEEG